MKQKVFNFGFCENFFCNRLEIDQTQKVFRKGGSCSSLSGRRGQVNSPQVRPENGKGAHDFACVCSRSDFKCLDAKVFLDVALDLFEYWSLAIFGKSELLWRIIWKCRDLNLSKSFIKTRKEDSKALR